MVAFLGRCGSAVPAGPRGWSGFPEDRGVAFRATFLGASVFGKKGRGFGLFARSFDKVDARVAHLRDVEIPTRRMSRRKCCLEGRLSLIRSRHCSPSGEASSACTAARRIDSEVVRVW
jgi:hypothetical protein